MKTYTCEECGDEFTRKKLDSELFKEGHFFCKSCSDFLIESARDFVDPNHNFDSYEDWDEHGR